MIQTENIIRVCISLEGDDELELSSAYVRFETDLSGLRGGVGDFYWQGDDSFFEIHMSDLMSGDEREEDVYEYISKDAIEAIKELFKCNFSDCY